jgi:hypothetical protein
VPRARPVSAQRGTTAIILLALGSAFISSFALALNSTNQKPTKLKLPLNKSRVPSQLYHYSLFPFFLLRSNDDKAITIGVLSDRANCFKQIKQTLIYFDITANDT